jgi:flagellar motor component MotA
MSSAWGLVGTMLGGVWAYNTLKPLTKKVYRKVKKKLKSY